MSMFDRYPQPADYIPDNRPRCCPKTDLIIMTGETSIHSFETPFDINDYCNNVEVIYKNGINVVLIKTLDEVEVSLDEHGFSIITVTMSPSESNLFENTLLDTSVQLKFTMRDYSVVFSKIYEVKVFDSLEDGESHPVPPQPGVLGGLGYTED